MINIKIPETRRREIAEEYFDRLVKYIDKHEYWSISDDVKAKVKVKAKIETEKEKAEKAKANEMMSHISEHRREYFLASAGSLKDRSDEFSRRYAKEKNEYIKASRADKRTTGYKLFEKWMRKIFKEFMQDDDIDNVPNGYWLMKELDVKVCPYCNNNYTITILKRDLKVRPEYDHFLPESSHPSLILSFYNLVPSCPRCNHLKKAEELDVNPWMESSEGEEPIFRVDTSKNDFPANPVIIINGENENTRKLGIKELYNEQTDYVKDILDKIQAYNPATYLAIVRDFQGIVHTIDDLERMVWGNYTDSSDSEKRPLAKLTADILEQYKKYL